MQGHVAASVLTSLDNLQLAACITGMPDLRYCPYCNAPAFLNGAGCMDGQCRECAFEFCASCLLPKHPAIRCSVAVHEVDPVVQKKFWENRLSFEWVKANTKPCPKCTVPIQKNEGCSHMTCRKCSYAFCWICLGMYQKNSSLCLLH